MTTGFWEQYLLPCRLADVEFPIVNLDDMEKLGVVAHEYPFRAGADLEHVGRGAARFHIVGAFFRQLEGYTTALYPSAYETLRARLRQNPLVTLVHPTLGFLDVGVEQMDASRDPEKRDGEFLTLTIVERGHASDLGTGVGQAPDVEQSLLAHAVVTPTIPTDPGLDFSGRVSALIEQAKGLARRADGLAKSAVEIGQGVDALIEEVLVARDAAGSVENGDRVRGCSLLLDDLATWRQGLSAADGSTTTIEYVVPAPTDLWQLSLSLYGDTSQVDTIESLNPTIAAVFLGTGARLIVPSPKAYARGPA